MSTVKDLHFDDEFVFDYKQGMRMAVAFSAYDDEEDWILDPSYGELSFNVLQWGIRDGKTFYERNKLNSHRCTPEELGIDGFEPLDRSVYEIHQSSKEYVKKY